MKLKRRENLKRLFAPRHVAFIGGNSAELAAHQCVIGGFKGAIWGVNPKRETMAGRPCFARIEDLPEAPDAVFLAVPSAVAVEVVNTLRKIGTGGVVCYTAGFGELGADGLEHERTLISAAGNMAFVGPNCSGMLNYVASAALWPFDHGGSPGGKPVNRGAAFITQSGMLGNTISMNQRSLPFSYVISSGNQGQMGVEDFLDIIIDDPTVVAIGLYIEGLRDVNEFVNAAVKSLKAGKPIVAQKAGTSEIGAQLTVTHTGSLSGTDALYQALFDRLGVIRVDSSVSMLETLKLITTAGIPKGNRVAGLTCSGGDSTMLADGGEPLGLSFPQPTVEVAKNLEKLLPSIATVANPLDYTTPLWGHEEALIVAFDTMFKDSYDTAIMVQDYPALVGGESYAPYCADVRAFEAATSRANIPGVVCSILPENLDGVARDDIAGRGLAPLQGINDALRSVAGVAKFGALMSRTGIDFERMKLVAVPSHNDKGHLLDEWEAKQLLATAGVIIPQGRLASIEDAPAVAEDIGFPVAVKLASADLPHKTDAGAVHLGLMSADEVARAVFSIQADVQAFDVTIGTGEFLVESMVTNPITEILVGVRHDPTFGLVMVIGSGGVLAEVMRDVKVLLLPTSEDDIANAVTSLNVGQLLSGFRRAPATDIEALIHSIVSIANFAQANAESIYELDVNPLVITQDGVWAVDALLLVSSNFKRRK